MPLEEEVSLDIADALRQVDALEAALTTSAQSFRVALAEALNVLQAVQVQDVDASAVTTGIDAAVAAADLSPQLEADASGVTTAIDTAVDASDTQVAVDAVTSSITDEINQAIADADTTVEIDADTSAAQDALDELGASGDDAGGGVERASAGLGGLAQNAALASAATRGAAGDTGALGGAMGSLGASGGAAVAVVGALGFGVDKYVTSAIEALTATRRFNDTFGGLAGTIEEINIPGLSTDISGLALSLGSDDDALRNTAANIGQIGITSGKTKGEVAETAQQIILLAARASALNPELGTADQIATRMGVALARGGRFASQFGISLTSAQIQARALSDTGKATASDLTQYEKAAAGAALATEQLGNRIGKDITDGADKPLIKLRSLKQSLEETFEASGAELIQPLTQDMESLQPIIENVARLLGPVLHLALLGLGAALDVVDAAIAAIAFGVQGLFELLSHAPFIGKKFGELADQAGDVKDQFLAAATGGEKVDTATSGAGDSADDAAGQFQTLTDEVSATEEALNALVDAEIAYLDSTVAAEEAQRTFSESLSDLDAKFQAVKDAVDKHGQSSKEAADAARDYEHALTEVRDNALHAAEAQLRLADDTATAEGRTLTAAERQDVFRTALQNLANQATGPTKVAIQDLIGKLDEAAKNRTASLDVNTAPAEEKIKSLHSRLLDFYKAVLNPPAGLRAPSHGSQAVIDQGNLFAPPGAMAGIVDFKGPGVVTVGERGRELAFVGEGQSMSVMPNAQSNGLLGASAEANAEFVAAMRRLGRQPATRGGGGVSIGELHVHEVTADPRTTAFAVATDVGEMARR